MSSFVFAQSLNIYTENNPPWNYEEDGKIKGVITKVVQKIQEDIGNKDEIKLLPWNRAYQETLKKRNHVLFGTARIEQREDLFQWIGPIVVDRVYIFQHKSSSMQVKTFEDAKKVATLDAGSVTNAAYIILKQKGFENLSNLSRNVGCVRSLQSARADLLALGEYVFRYKVASLGLDLSKFSNTGILVYESPLYIAFSKSTDKKRVQKWKNSFEKLKKRGIIEELIQNELEKIIHDAKN